MTESLAAMKALLNIKVESEVEIEEEVGVRIGKEREAEGKEEKEDETEENEEIGESEDSEESEEDDIVDEEEEEEKSYPIHKNSINRMHKKASDIGPGSTVESITHININTQNVRERIHELESNSKFKMNSKLKLKLKSKLNSNSKGIHIKNNNGGRNWTLDRFENGEQSMGRSEDHIIIVTRDHLKVNTNRTDKNVLKNTQIHDKSLISMKNKTIFAECSSHLEACSDGMIRLKALIDTDEVNLTLVVHEPEIWRK